MASNCNNIPILVGDSKSGFAILLPVMVFLWYESKQNHMLYALKNSPVQYYHNLIHGFALSNEESSKWSQNYQYTFRAHLNKTCKCRKVCMGFS